MWFIVTIFLTGIIHLSGADIFEMCLKQKPQCRRSNNLTCSGGIIQLISLKFIVEDTPPALCCNLQSDCKVDYANYQKERLIQTCAGKRWCSISTEGVQVDGEYIEKKCEYDEHYHITATVIEYSCTKDVTSKALPATGNPDNTGDTGGSSTLLIAIITVVAALIVTGVVITGVVIYRRRSRKKSNGNDHNTQESTTTGVVNTGFENEYNTIPADYEGMPEHSYQVIDGIHADKDNAYSKKRRDNSVNYCTIVLNEDTETDSKSYGYDRTNQKIRYEANKLQDQERLHSYGHFSETSDDYNKIKSKENQHNLDKAYSHFEVEPANDYSHLNDRNKDLKHMTNNDYSHLQTKVMSAGQAKCLDSYEKPVLKGLLHLNDDRSNELKSVHKNGEYESPVKEVDAMTNVSMDGQIKRKGSYEEPMLISALGRNDVLKNEPKVNFKMRDDYEEPINLKENSANTIDVSTNGTMKRKDSYETPVLKNTEEMNDVPNINSKTGDNYETPVNLKDNSFNNVDVRTNVAMKRKDSYEIPILKNTDVINDAIKVNSKTNDNYEPPLSLPASEYIPENVQTETSTDNKPNRVDSYETPILKCKVEWKPEIHY